MVDQELHICGSWAKVARQGHSFPTEQCLEKPKVFTKNISSVSGPAFLIAAIRHIYLARTPVDHTPPCSYCLTQDLCTQLQHLPDPYNDLSLSSLAWMPLSPDGFRAGNISCDKKGLAEKYKTLVKPGRKVEEHGF